MSTILTIQALFNLLLYSLLVISFYFGWRCTKKYKPDQRPPVTRVSIIIPCRNEAANIAELNSLLNNQDYPRELLEIIWIDDHSTDRTGLILEKMVHHLSNQKLIQLTGKDCGKKAALKAGMEIATGELILLTDADSRPGIRWVKTMAKYFEDTGSDLILGPVVLNPALGWFDQIQKLEYLSLVASSIGAAGLGRPIMAQGPNIGVRASDYASLVNDLDNRFASGDDVFLLQAMKKIPGKKIGYLLNPDAIVRSKPADNLSGFLHQRQRWASKASGYSDWFMITTSVLVFITNLEILASLLLAICGILPLYLTVILIGIKTAVDLPLLIVSTRFFKCQKLLVWLVPVQILYPIYIAVAGALSQLAPVRWKTKR